MPSTSAKQKKFMRAIASGWKPTRIKDPPSRAVATEFMEADRKYSGGFAENRYYTGGLAAMNMQEGGPMNYYQEGGATRPGHAEKANPYPEGSARYKLWERKYHEEPAPPPVVEEAEDISWLQRLLGAGDIKSRSERELEALGEAHGGRVHYPRGYQYGGLAAANFQPPGGGVPPRLPGGGVTKPRLGGVPPTYGGRITPPPGKYPGGFPGRGPIGLGGVPTPPGGGGPYRGLPPGAVDGAGPGGVPGGARVPPNLRGYLQRQRMMNRPPPNVGGGVNRVGQQDQQGALARALQRGTGRPPMSRRAGFPGRNIR